MYRSFDEEVFLAPESIVSGVVAMADIADDGDLPGVEPGWPSWRPATASVDDELDAPDAEGGAAAGMRATGDPIDAWSRHASRTSGFGG